MRWVGWPAGALAIVQIRRNYSALFDYYRQLLEMSFVLPTDFSFKRSGA